MFELAEYLVETGTSPLSLAWTRFLLMFSVGFFLLMGFFMPVGGLMTYVERKIAAFTQSRIGPNRVGPFGLLQFLADGVKLILKEDIIPAAVDRPLFKLAPYAVVGGAFLVMVVLPLGPNLLVSDQPLGLLVYLAASSFVTMGIVMSGWASSNKWSTMGAARSVAQIVSYEIPVGLALIPGVLLAGSLSFQSMAWMQGPYPWQWNMFHNPGMFLCTFAYFIAALAEINRTPFDIPEAESELVSGYNTEYSGMRFGMFFMAEFANVLIISIVTVVVFLGAWHFPFEGRFVEWAFGAQALANYANGVTPISFVETLKNGSWPYFIAFNAIGHGALLAKSGVLVVLIILLRWTLPRVRVDQLMDICWKYLVPVTIFSTVLTGAWMIIPGASGLNWNGIHAAPWKGHAFFWVGAAILLFFVVNAFVQEHRARWSPARGTIRHHRTDDGKVMEVAHGR